jgi:hypothetical protein
MTEDQVREALHQQGLYVVDMSFEDPPPAAQPHDAGPLVFSVCFFHAVLSRMRVFLCRCDEKVLDWRVTCSHTLAGDVNMEDSEGGRAAQATPQEALKESQQAAGGDAMEEDRPPHMEWTYKVRWRGAGQAALGCGR